MPKIEDWLSTAILLLPGFLASSVRYRYHPADRRSELDRVVESLIASVAIYSLSPALFDGLVSKIYVVLGLAFPAGGYAALSQDLEGLVVFAVAILVGLAWARAQTCLWLYGAIAWLAGSSRTAGISVWVEMLRRNRKNWVRVRLKSGVIYDGWTAYHSDEQNVCELFLQEATRYEGDRKRTVDGPGVYIDVRDAEAVELLTGIEPAVKKRLLGRYKKTLLQGLIVFASLAAGFLLGSSLC